MKKNSLVTLPILLVLFNFSVVKAQYLQNPLTLYPHEVNLNATPPQVNLLPQANSAYNNSYSDANAAYDQNGNLVFFLVVDVLYDADGYYFGVLDIQPQGCGYFLQETNIIPVPGNGSKFYVVYGVACTPNGSDLLYSIISCDENGCSIEENGELISSYIYGNFIGIAISNLLQNNTHRMYISRYGQIQKFEIASSGITFSNTVHQNFSNPWLFDTYQLELSSDNTKLAWGGTVFVGNKLNIIELDQSGNFLNYNSVIVSDGVYIPSDNARIVGVEFSIDVPKVYFSIVGGATESPYGGIFYYDFTAGMISNVVYDNYRYTHLQKDYNGYIYGVSDDGTNLCQIDPTANSFIPSYLSVNVFSNASAIGVPLYTLPDLIDYRNLMFETSFTPESCASVSDGTASVSICGGAPPYSYQWNDPAGQTTATATNLPPGIYICVVTDATNNTVSAQVEIVTDPALFTHLGDWHIYGQEEISGFAAIDGDIHIYSGGTLEIDGNLEFNANKGIIIYDGGALELTNNAIISGLSVCNNNNWNGVVIHENANFTVNNNCTISKGNVVLEAGKKLTMTQITVLFEDNRIIVKHGNVLPYTSGSKLILDGTAFTSVQNKTWHGIEVWGDEDVAQLPDAQGNYAQGFLELKNSALIENTTHGIELWRPNYWETTGGIIKAENSTFRNNSKPIHALYYHNINPFNPNSELDYFGRFKNCVFEITSSYHGEATFYKHIDLNNVKGFKFEGCDFSVDPAAQGVSPYTAAISANNAGFSVTAYCTSQTSPCSAYNHCTFYGFNNAIHAAASSSIYTFNVERAMFNNNNCGIKVQAVNNFSVLWSEFYIGHNTTDQDDCDGIGMAASGYGINSNASTGFAIEENYFTKASGAPEGNYTGIRIAETNATDQVYSNTFNGLSYGNYAVGINWFENYFKGLAYYCNENTGNYVDFYVEPDNLPQKFSGIQSKQGDDNFVTGNTFTTTGNTWHFYNGGDYLVGYYYCNYCDDESPAESKIFQVTDKPKSFSNNCPSHYGGGGSTEKSIVLTTSEKQEAEMEFAVNLSNYNNVKTLYDNLKDGGNTDAVIADIENAWPTDMWELRAQLLGKSPHLSMEVLKTAADKTDVLPESIIFEVMAANPDELKKEELIRYLEDKADPLPGYMINILRHVAQGTTYKTVLEQHMAHYNQVKTRAAYDIVRSLLNDTISDPEQLRNWLDNVGGRRADEQIIASFIAENNFTDALALANMMPVLYNYTGYELSEHNFYMDMLNLQIQLSQEGRTVYDLYSNEVSNLEAIAENSTGTAGAQAKGILEFVYGYHYCDCLNVSDSAGFKSSGIINPKDFAKAYGLEITTEPNPASEWVAFNYTLPYDKSEGTIWVVDTKGSFVTSFKVTGMQGQKVWDTRKLNSGVYFYTLSVGEFTQSGKIVISK